MAQEESKVVMSADDTDIARAWQRQFQMLDKLARKLDDAGRQADRANKATQQSFRESVMAMVTYDRAIGAAIASLKKLIELEKQYQREKTEVSLERDVAFRRFAVQSGRTSEAQLAQDKARISRAAVKYSATGQQASLAATELVSLGFSAEDATGGGLEEILQFAASTNQLAEGQDPRELIRGLVRYLQGTGQELTVENLRKAAIGTFNLFKGTPVQASDIARYGQDAAAVTSLTGASGEEQLAAMSSLLEVTDASQASTQLRNVSSILATIGTDQRKMEALGRLGLSAEDVDFQGESFTEVFQRLKRATAGMDAKTRNEALTQIFGRENVAGALRLISESDKFDQRAAVQRDEQAYRETVQFATAGPAAAKRRSGERRDVKLDDPEFAYGASKQEELGTEVIDQPVAGRSRAFVREEAYEWAQFGGMSPGAAESAARGADAGLFYTNPIYLLWDFSTRVIDAISGPQEITIIDEEGNRRTGVKKPVEELSRQ